MTVVAQPKSPRANMNCRDLEPFYVRDSNSRNKMYNWNFIEAVSEPYTFTTSCEKDYAQLTQSMKVKRRQDVSGLSQFFFTVATVLLFRGLEQNK